MACFVSLLLYLSFIVLSKFYVLFQGPFFFFYSDGMGLFSDGIDHPTESAKTVFFPIGLKKIRRIVCISMESFCKPFFFAQKKNLSESFRRNRVLGRDLKNDNYVFL